MDLHWHFCRRAMRQPASPPAQEQRPRLRARRSASCTWDGGEAQVVSHLKNGVSAFQWSPDGKRFVAVSRTGPSDEVAPNARKSDVRHYTHISYKFNDTGWYDDKRSHLWVVEAVGRQRQADHVRRRLERYRSAMVARWRAHRLRLRPHGTRVRRRPQQRCLGDPCRRRGAHQNLRSRFRRRSAALVARWQADCVRWPDRRGANFPNYTRFVQRWRRRPS